MAYTLARLLKGSRYGVACNSVSFARKSAPAGMIARLGNFLERLPPKNQKWTQDGGAIPIQLRVCAGVTSTEGKLQDRKGKKGRKGSQMCSNGESSASD